MFLATVSTLTKIVHASKSTVSKIKRHIRHTQVSNLNLSNFKFDAIKIFAHIKTLTLKN
jgi:hypothetical protein